MCRPAKSQRILEVYLKARYALVGTHNGLSPFPVTRRRANVGIQLETALQSCVEVISPVVTVPVGQVNLYLNFTLGADYLIYTSALASA